MANYTFIFQANAEKTVDFFFQVGQEAPTSSKKVKVTKDDTVAFLLLPVAGSAHTMESVELIFSETVSGEGVCPFVQSDPLSNTFVWKVGMPPATAVDHKGAWGFKGLLKVQNSTDTYVLHDPEVIVDDGQGAAPAAEAA